MDPASQFANAYAYAGNGANPVIMVDEDGNFILSALLIGAAIGAAANYISYGATTGKWLSGQAFAMAGVGALAGVATAATAGAASGLMPASFAASTAGSMVSGAVGGLVGGAVGGMGGYSVGAAYGDYSWNLGDFLSATGTSSLSGMVGGAAGGAASTGIGNISINGTNIASPVLKGIVGGGTGGYVGGFTGGLIASGGDLKQANKAGLGGMAMGITAGGVGGYVSAKANGINPWTGKANQSITIGENQIGRVNPAAKDLNSGTIRDEWPSHNFNMDPLKGKQFNAEWIEIKMQQDYYIYDIGPKGPEIQSPFYRMEAAKTYNYPKTISVQHLQVIQNIRILVW